MTLLDLINSQNFPSGTTADQIAAALNAQTVSLFTTTLQTSTDIILAVGEANADAFFAAFETAMAGSAMLRSQYQKLNSTGLDFSNALVQAQITGMVAANLITSQLGASLQAMGVQQTSPYAQWAGAGQTVTSAQVTTAMAPLTQTGQSKSLHVHIDQNGNTTVACSIMNYAGSQQIGMDEAFQATNGVGTNLTTAQQAFVNSVLALVIGYEG